MYDVSISGFTRSSIYVFDISSLRVNRVDTANAFCKYIRSLVCFQTSEGFRVCLVLQ